MSEASEQSAAEQAERAEMFGFHPDILAEAGSLPRTIETPSTPAHDEEQSGVRP